LLSNGKVVRGEIARDPASGDYLVRQKIGQAKYPASLVLHAGSSLIDLYRFQVERLPNGDPDERMKLVRWCLAERLMPQAREQLTSLLQLCPDDREAKAMLLFVDSAAARAARVDTEVRRTSGDDLEGQPPASPEPMAPNVARSARRNFGGASGLPQIFDLPAAAVARRATEFTQAIQPILQVRCARCHNENYQGNFQLVEIKSKRDRTPDIARTNLEATIRLVNPDDPMRSDLLSAGLVPHGGNRNGIFRGAKDREYATLERWVMSLRPATPATAKTAGDGVNRAGYNPGGGSPLTPVDGGGFGADRGGDTATPPATLPPGITGASARPMPRTPAGPVVATPPNLNINEVYTATADPSGLPDSAFPVPFAVGGARDKTTQVKPSKPAAAADPALPALPGAAPATTAKPAGNGAVLVDVNGDPNLLPGMNQAKYPPKPKADGEDEAPAPATKKKAKPKIDPALLEGLMKNRNGAP
jgi:hypothetical protein